MPAAVSRKLCTNSDLLRNHPTRSTSMLTKLSTWLTVSRKKKQWGWKKSESNFFEFFFNFEEKNTWKSMMKRGETKDSAARKIPEEICQELGMASASFDLGHCRAFSATDMCMPRSMQNTKGNMSPLMSLGRARQPNFEINRMSSFDASFDLSDILCFEKKLMSSFDASFDLGDALCFGKNHLPSFDLRDDLCDNLFDLSISNALPSTPRLRPQKNMGLGSLPPIKDEISSHVAARPVPIDAANCTPFSFSGRSMLRTTSSSPSADAQPAQGQRGRSGGATPRGCDSGMFFWDRCETVEE